MALLPGSPLAFFVRTFLPSFSKSTVTQQIDILKNEIATKTLPPYASLVEPTTGFNEANPFVAKWNKAFNDTVMKNRTINFKNRDWSLRPINCIAVTYNVLSHLNERLTYLNDLIDKSFNEDIIGTQLSYQQANLLRLVEMSEFFLIYARRLAIYLVANEYKELEKTPSTEDPLTKGDIKWLETNMLAFIGMLGIYSTNKEDFIRAVKSIPDIQVAETKDEIDVINKVHGKNVDGLGLGFVPYVLNPIYHIRIKIVEWRHNRIEAAKQERELLEMRIQQYIMKRGGKDNAKMDQVINNAQESLKKLNKKIHDMEESYNADYNA